MRYWFRIVGPMLLAALERPEWAGYVASGDIKVLPNPKGKEDRQAKRVRFRCQELQGQFFKATWDEFGDRAWGVSR